MKALKVIRSVVVWLIVALAAAMMVFTIVSVSTFDRADRSLFGYKAFIILTDSMSKTDFEAGDLALVKEVDPSTLKEGDIIAYTSQNTANYGETVTHKIRRLTTDANGQPGFITYGTTTDTDDETVVTYPYVIGKYSTHIPKIGTFFQFLKTTPGYIVCILIQFLVLILHSKIKIQLETFLISLDRNLLTGIILFGILKNLFPLKKMLMLILQVQTEKFVIMLHSCLRMVNNE